MNTAVVFAYQGMGLVGLNKLADHGYDVRLVITHREDSERAQKVSPVADYCKHQGLECLKLEEVVSLDVAAAVKAVQPDFIYSFYCRRILPGEMLHMARRGALNLHDSLLPKYRGCCPVNWVLVNGEEETGVSLHYMEPEVDAGDLVGQKKVLIDYRDTAKTLCGKLEITAADLLDAYLPALLVGNAPRISQDASCSTYYGGLRPADRRIDWFRPSKDVYNLVRAVTHPYPGAFFECDGERLFIWKVDECPEHKNLLPGEVCYVGDQVWMGTGTSPVWLRYVSWRDTDYTDFDVLHCALLKHGKCMAW